MIKIDHINLSVTNLAEAKKIFTNLLGFTVINEGELVGEWIEKLTGLKKAKALYSRLVLSSTETCVELIQYLNPLGEKDSKISLANQIGFRHLAFEVNDIQQTYNKLKNNGIHFLSEIQTRKGKKICYFLGPDDVILELAEYD